MSASRTPDFSRLLAGFHAGDPAATHELVELVYQELRQLAHHHLRRERAQHELQTTALVHEVYLRMFSGEQIEWQDRRHFFVVAAQQMRRVLIDYARRAHSAKRQGLAPHLSLEEIADLPQVSECHLPALDDALRVLEHLYPRVSRVVELRFFGGLTEVEAAAVLGVAPATIKRDWRFAKAWLYTELTRAQPGRS